MSDIVELRECPSRVETATEKLRTLRKLCECSHQPLYVEILDEVLATFEEPSCEGILEVRPCVDRLGHIVSYDLCPPHEEGATCGPVMASVFGKEYADKLAAAWNAALTRTSAEERLREALRTLLASCTSTTPNVHDGCGTRIVTAPSVEALKIANAALNETSAREEE